MKALVVIGCLCFLLFLGIVISVANFEMHVRDEARVNIYEDFDTKWDSFTQYPTGLIEKYRALEAADVLAKFLEKDQVEPQLAEDRLQQVSAWFTSTAGLSKTEENRLAHVNKVLNDGEPRRVAQRWKDCIAKSTNGYDC